MKCETLLTIVNSIICTVIFLRVFYFKRDGRQHCKKGGWLAFLILAYSSSVPIRAYFDPNYHADIYNIFANILICTTLLVSKGNVIKFIKG
ncbi:TPA: phage holin family protein [Proteus mirabilis]|uniref:phage holin family protein n=1 Tax=Proteus mirabilis TaxID=584 RepID=UPI00228C7A24|nr:phage holin family protein [Proteus mirabilis]